MSGLDELLSRVEGASDQLDDDTLGRIICAVNGWSYGGTYVGTGDDGSDDLSVFDVGEEDVVWSGYRSRCPDVSLDAALALVERVLPGAMWQVGFDPDDGSMCARLVTVPPPCAHAKANHDTAPLAMCAALLKALAAGQGASGSVVDGATHK